MPTGLILQPTYQIRDERPVVRLFGRLLDGPPFLVEDDRFRPYLFVKARDVAALGSVPGMSVDVRDLRDLEGAPVARVVLPLPSAVPALRDRLAGAGVATFEADVRFAYRYLIDHGVRALASIEGPSEERDGLVVFSNPRLAPASGRPQLRVLSLDIETTPDASRVLSFALAGCGTEEVHIVGAEPVAGRAEFVPIEIVQGVAQQRGRRGRRRRQSETGQRLEKLRGIGPHWRLGGLGLGGVGPSLHSEAWGPTPTPPARN